MDLVDGVSWVGENLYITSAGQYEGVARDAIQAWYNEKSDYDYDSNTCMSGRVCGHYTQVSRLPLQLLYTYLYMYTVKMKCTYHTISVVCDTVGVAVIPKLM